MHESLGFFKELFAFEVACNNMRMTSETRKAQDL